jgi:hypothetical protein
MHSRVALAASLAASLAWIGACGGDESDPDPTRSLAAGRERADTAAAASEQNNSAPVISKVTFNPPQPLSEGSLEALVSAEDPDGNLVQLSYAWLVNGRELSSGNASAIQLPVLERGDRIEVVVTASDGRLASEPYRAAVRSDNLPPQINFLYITPQNKKIRRGDVLTAVPDAIDPEGDHLEFTYEWRVNGAKAGSDRQFDTAKLRRGDEITVTVVANDGNAESSPRTLDKVTLINSAPTIVKLPELERQGSTLTYQFEAEDAEGDRNLRFFLADAPDGMEIDAYTGLLSWRPRPDQAGKHLVKVGVKDSEGDASQFEWEVVVNAAAAEPAPAARDDE